MVHINRGGSKVGKVVLRYTSSLSTLNHKLRVTCILLTDIIRSLTAPSYYSIFSAACLCVVCSSSLGNSENDDDDDGVMMLLLEYKCVPPMRTIFSRVPPYAPHHTHTHSTCGGGLQLHDDVRASLLYYVHNIAGELRHLGARI